MSFEGDEAPTFKQWRFFEDCSIWASDAYHTDGSDVWTAMREMIDCGVPEAVQAKMLGSSAAGLYRIEPKMFVSEEAAPLDRPDWFPQGEELERFTDLSKDPRKNMTQVKMPGEYPAMCSNDSASCCNAGNETFVRPSCLGERVITDTCMICAASG